MSDPQPYNIPMDEQRGLIWKGSPEAQTLRKVLMAISPALGNSQRLVAGIAIIAPGYAAPLHNHPDAEEVNVVIKGRGYLVNAEGVRVPIAAGDIQHIPQGAFHAHGCEGTEDMHFFFAYTPPTSLPKG